VKKISKTSEIKVEAPSLRSYDGELLGLETKTLLSKVNIEKERKLYKKW
jgi:hypothetical protein